MTERKKKVVDIGFEVEELSNLQKELVEGISGLVQFDEKTRTRVQRIVKRKLEKCRMNVRAQDLLEKIGAIEVER